MTDEALTQPDANRAIRLVGTLAVFLLIAAALLSCWFSRHWIITWDAAVMHYVSFLIDHGMRPYTDITDSNMPGAYLAEKFAIRVFGSGNLAWRLYDISLDLLLTASMVVIARPYDWRGGLYGGLMFTVLHASDGPKFAGEREQVMTTLLLAALALLLSSLRRSRPLFMLPAGLLLGLAVTIKPTVLPLAACFGVAAVWVLYRRRKLALQAVAALAAGFALAAALALLFLLHFQAVGSFFFVLRRLLPSYVALQQLGFGTLARLLLPLNLLLLMPFGLLLAMRRRWTHEHWLILTGLAFGAISYFAQRKGYPYHRYPFLAFLLLLLGTEFFTGLSRDKLSASLATAGLLLTCALSLPHYVRMTGRNTRMDFSQVMSARLSQDLASLGARSLESRVQCFDLTYGCYSALYHDRIVQATGYTGDLLLFSPTPSAAATYYRDRFWQIFESRPFEVIVFGNQWFQGENTYAKVATWPLFRNDLEANYTAVLSRSFSVDGTPPRTDNGQLPAYRLYIRNGSPLLQRAKNLCQQVPPLTTDTCSAPAR